LKTGEIKKFKNKSDNLKEGLVNRNDKFLSDEDYYVARNLDIYAGVFLFLMKFNKLDIYIKNDR